MTESLTLTGRAHMTLAHYGENLIRQTLHLLTFQTPPPPFCKTLHLSRLGSAPGSSHPLGNLTRDLTVGKSLGLPLIIPRHSTSTFDKFGDEDADGRQGTSLKKPCVNRRLDKECSTLGTSSLLGKSLCASRASVLI